MISSVPMKETDECVLKVVGVPGLDQESIHHGNQDNEECTLVLAVPCKLASVCGADTTTCKEWIF